MAAKYVEIEIYKPIAYNKYTRERYEISNLGHVRNKTTGKILTNVARPNSASVTLQIGNGQQNVFTYTFWLPDIFFRILRGFRK